MAYEIVVFRMIPNQINLYITGTNHKSNEYETRTLLTYVPSLLHWIAGTGNA